MAEIRVIVNGVSYYATKSAIKKQTTSDHTMQNNALFHALHMMGRKRGIATTVALDDGALLRHEFAVQLCVV